MNPCAKDVVHSLRNAEVLHTDDVILYCCLVCVYVIYHSVCTSVNTLYASPRQQYRDYVIGVKREFRQSAKS